MKIAIQFGAGAIGRGLLGKIIHDSGYKLIFVDVFDKIVDQINEDGYVGLELMDHENKAIKLENVSALCSSKDEDLEKIYEAITKADIITTSVRVENLDSTSKIIAKGLEKKDPSTPKVDIMAFENAFRASDILKGHLLQNTSLTEEEVDSLATFPNTVTDRIVQNKTVDGRSVVEISDDFEAVIEQTKLKDSTSKPIKDAEYTQNIDEELERKLFLVNGVHAATSYFGYYKGYTMMDEAFGDEEILSDVKKLMEESSKVLIKKYGFDKVELDKFKESKLNRFLKTASHDEVARVARDPQRKLGKTDRLVSPAISAYDNNLEYDYLAKAIAYAFKYDNKEDEKALEIQDYIKENGIEKAIEHFAEIKKDERSGLFEKIVEEYEKID
ncbi:aspartate carbamoyltransferase [Anaerococcus porci]|uniref:mannitol dehydrogenase family protein n=1 Tax=Anaerococcus porci TaxID=2652269 RepID=UPI002A7645C6|nr:aspartate carbamoyltransferase [Anaerococcus porci]MDY3005668.1 aspartate carbamoyltransferase [Anaerococcus porci]